MMSGHQTSGHGTLPILTFFGVIPLIIVGVAVVLDGRPHHQEIVVTALSAGNPQSGIPVRILVDQGATCDGDGYDLEANDRGIAGVSHAARLGVLEARGQSVAVCLHDEGGWTLAWSSHHRSAPALLSIACDVTDANAPECETRFAD